jgi:hypothetical protein
MPANVAARLARSWDLSGVGGLTNADYADILATDPFAVNPAFNPNADTTGRYTKQIGQTFNYVPAPPGGQAVTQFFSTTADDTSTIGSGTEDTHSVSVSVQGSVDFTSRVSAAVKVTGTHTTVSKKTVSTTSTTAQTASLSITGPLASDNYTGPTAIQIWRDNIYGSFMFYGAQ